MFVLELARQARAPANAAVGAGHVRDGCARRRGFEPVGLRHHVSDLIAAPTVTLDSNRVFVHETFVHDGLDSRQYALQRALARIADRVDNVGQENQIAIADVESGIDGSAGRGIAKRVQALRQLFVDVDNHRILACRIEVFGLEQDALQRHAVDVLEIDQFRRAPIELRSLRVAVTDFLEVSEIRTRHPEIGKLVKTRSREHQDVGIFCFGRIVEVLRVHHQFFRQAAVNHVAIKS